MTQIIGQTFPVLCIYEDEGGTSHLIDLELPAMGRTIQADGTSIFSGVSGATVFGVATGEVPEFVDWHTSKQLGLAIVLFGEWEIEAGSGQRRVMKPGSVLLMFDNNGQGHRAHYSGMDRCASIGVGIDSKTAEAYRKILTQALEAQS